MSDEIKFKITLDGKEFMATASLSDQALDKLADKLGSVKSKGKDSFTSLAADWGNVITGLNQGIQLLNQVVDVISKPIKTAAMFEGFETQLKVMLGSTQAAKERMKELADFAATTPFTLPEVVSASNRLQALGRYSIETIRTLGDLAAASGKPFDQVMNAYSSLVSGQKGEAIRMFRDLLITSKDWARATGAVIKNGEVMTSTDELARALPRIMKERGFDGMMAQQAQTMNGIVSNFEDAMTRMGNATGKLLLPTAKENISNFTSIISDLTTLMERLYNVGANSDDETVRRMNPFANILTGFKNVMRKLVQDTTPEQTVDDFLDKQINAWKASLDKRKKLLEELNDASTPTPKRSKGVNKSADDMIEAERKRLEDRQKAWVDTLQDEATAEERALEESRQRNEEWAADVLRIRREKQDEERLAWAQGMREDPATQARDAFMRDTTYSFRSAGNALAGAMADGMLGAKIKWGTFLRDLARMVAASAIKSALINLFSLAVGGTPFGNFLGVKAAAKGAVIDQPTLLLAGEAGREYYVPEANMKNLISTLLSGGLTQAATGPSITSGIATLMRSYSGGSGASRASSPSAPSNNALINEIRAMHDTLIAKDMMSVFAGDLKDDKIFERQRIEKGVRIKYTM